MLESAQEYLRRGNLPTHKQEFLALADGLFAEDILQTLSRNSINNPQRFVLEMVLQHKKQGNDPALVTWQLPDNHSAFVLAPDQITLHQLKESKVPVQVLVRLCQYFETPAQTCSALAQTPQYDGSLVVSLPAGKKPSRRLIADLGINLDMARLFQRLQATQNALFFSSRDAIDFYKNALSLALTETIFRQRYLEESDQDSKQEMLIWVKNNGLCASLSRLPFPEAKAEVAKMVEELSFHFENVEKDNRFLSGIIGLTVSHLMSIQKAIDKDRAPHFAEWAWESATALAAIVETHPATQAALTFLNDNPNPKTRHEEVLSLPEDLYNSCLSQQFPQPLSFDLAHTLIQAARAGSKNGLVCFVSHYKDLILRHLCVLERTSLSQSAVQITQRKERE